MVAVLKVWAPNEATAALLLEGAELRLHRCAKKAWAGRGGSVLRLL